MNGLTVGTTSFLRTNRRHNVVPEPIVSASSTVPRQNASGDSFTSVRFGSEKRKPLAAQSTDAILQSARGFMATALWEGADTYFAEADRRLTNDPEAALDARREVRQALVNLIPKLGDLPARETDRRQEALEALEDVGPIDLDPTQHEPLNPVLSKTLDAGQAALKSSDWTAALEHYNAAFNALDAENPSQTAHAVAALHALAEAKTNLGEPDQAKADLENALGLQTRYADALTPNVMATTEIKLAKLLLPDFGIDKQVKAADGEETERAIALFKKGLGRLKAAKTNPDALPADKAQLGKLQRDAYAGLGQAHLEEGAYDDALEAFRHGLALARRHEHGNTFPALVALAGIAHSVGKIAGDDTRSVEARDKAYHHVDDHYHRAFEHAAVLQGLQPALHSEIDRIVEHMEAQYALFDPDEAHKAAELAHSHPEF